VAGGVGSGNGEGHARTRKSCTREPPCARKRRGVGGVGGRRLWVGEADVCGWEEKRDKIVSGTKLENETLTH
jgi:hypothetical protein